MQHIDDSILVLEDYELISKKLTDLASENNNSEFNEAIYFLVFKARLLDNDDLLSLVYNIFLNYNDSTQGVDNPDYFRLKHILNYENSFNFILSRGWSKLTLSKYRSVIEEKFFKYEQDFICLSSFSNFTKYPKQQIQLLDTYYSTNSDNYLCEIPDSEEKAKIFLGLIGFLIYEKNKLLALEPKINNFLESSLQKNVERFLTLNERFKVLDEKLNNPEDIIAISMFLYQVNDMRVHFFNDYSNDIYKSNSFFALQIEEFFNDFKHNVKTNKHYRTRAYLSIKLNEVVVNYYQQHATFNIIVFLENLDTTNYLQSNEELRDIRVMVSEKHYSDIMPIQDKTIIKVLKF